jgi:hypothetical protein
MTATIRPEALTDHEAIRHVHRIALGQDAEARLVECPPILVDGTACAGTFGSAIASGAAEDRAERKRAERQGAGRRQAGGHHERCHAYRGRLRRLVPIRGALPRMHCTTASSG